MRKTLRSGALPAALLLIGAAPARQAPPAPHEDVRGALERVARALADGVAEGDWAPWERHASEDLLYTTELGRTMTKAELRAIFRPLPPERRRRLAIRVTGCVARPEAAVLVYELRAQEPGTDERYRVTDTYWRTAGRWRLVASQAGRIDDGEERQDVPEGGAVR